MAHGTKQRPLDEGLALLLEQGYNHLASHALLKKADVPGSSFYHHFASKEDLSRSTPCWILTSVP